MRRLSRHSLHRGCLTSIVLLLALSCTGANNDADGLRDDLGRYVTVDQAPQRIVSLSPAITEILFDLGLGDRLAGRTRWDVYPPEALEVEDVGDGMPPNIEAVAATNPDLVLFYASDVNRRPIEQLASLGIQSFSVRVDLLESMPEILNMLGAITGTTERARTLADRFRVRLDSASAAIDRQPDPVRVAILTWDNPPIVIGGKSFLTEVLVLAGAENVFGDIDEPSANVSIESIADRDPDVFLVTTGGSEPPAFTERPEWRVLRAVSEGRFAFVDGTEFQWPTVRAFGAVPELRAALERAASRSVSTAGN